MFNWMCGSELSESDFLQKKFEERVLLMLAKLIKKEREDSLKEEREAGKKRIRDSAN